MKKHPELNFSPPSAFIAKNLMIPFTNYFSPQFFGLEQLDASKPAMFVSNHSVLGIFDAYPFAIELYIKKGIFLRALVDSNHFKVPIWRDLMTDKMGVVEASRENCKKIMERKESLVVYPGGAREVCKKKGEAYELKWSDRNGFVRMAMEHGYDIIPVAAVGAEEVYTIVKDANDILNNSGIGKILKLTGIAKNFFKDGDLLPPLVKGIGNTLIPKPEKLYFAFGERIATKKYKPKFEDPMAQQLIKARVELALLEQFEMLFEKRKKDKNVGTIRKFLTKK